jgi:hypothetical protein
MSSTRASGALLEEGSRLTATYDNDHIAPEQRTNRFLDDAI